MKSYYPKLRSNLLTYCIYCMVLIAISILVLDVILTHSRAHKVKNQRFHVGDCIRSYYTWEDHKESYIWTITGMATNGYFIYYIDDVSNKRLGMYIRPFDMTTEDHVITCPTIRK